MSIYSTKVITHIYTPLFFLFTKTIFTMVQLNNHGDRLRCDMLEILAADIFHFSITKMACTIYCHIYIIIKLLFTTVYKINRYENDRHFIMVGTINHGEKYYLYKKNLSLSCTKPYCLSHVSSQYPLTFAHHFFIKIYHILSNSYGSRKIVTENARRKHQTRFFEFLLTLQVRETFPPFIFSFCK